MKLRILAMILASLLLLPCLFACAEDKPGKDDPSVQEESTEHDPFADMDFGGEEFWIYTSINAASTGMGNSNFMIQGEETDSTDNVASSVHKRNLEVEELLGIELQYVPSDLMYTQVTDDIKRYVTAGSDEFDLIINDLFPLAGLSINGYFVNTLDPDYHFDFSQNYWYSDYMADVSFVEGYQYLLAGDYFADIIRSAHCLFYNKPLYEDKYGDPEELYQIVLDYEWTQAKMLEIIEDNYVDLNGNGTADTDDQYGYAICDIWGCSIPLITSGDCNYMERDAETGYPVITINNDRTHTLTESIYHLMYSKGTGIFLEQELLDAFVNDKAMIVGYQRLGSLENMRHMEHDAGVIPYPMLLASDKQYTTSSHDTTEVGVIMTTAIDDMDFISAVLEVLCRETGKTVMPQYYEVSLKIKYSDDPQAGAMIDIIHDNFRNVFPLAYDTSLGEPVKTVIYTTIAAKSYNVASKLAKVENTCKKQVNKLITQFEKHMDE